MWGQGFKKKKFKMINFEPNFSTSLNIFNSNHRAEVPSTCIANIYTTKTSTKRKLDGKIIENRARDANFQII